MRGEGVTPLKDTIKVLNGFGRSLESDPAQAEERLHRRRLRPRAATVCAATPRASSSRPSGECFHNTTVTGGKPASEGPLALKRDLRETEKKLAAVEAAAARG